ncbi:hypothetical protein NDU88_003764 [Pleurodeles waltl]|uniref:Uncharacterized protein n=1 Tax=Pleurodeles waltl TaxID=8319 RepID=A0AAV7T5S0_PLEWA|nr:hypothetical protein NDU88_003764 [Pleurodeles waltl]
MAGPDPSDTQEVSDSWSESDGSSSAAVCTWDPRSEPLNEAAASMAFRLSVCISTGEGLFTIRVVSPQEVHGVKPPQEYPPALPCRLRSVVLRGELPTELRGNPGIIATNREPLDPSLGAGRHVVCSP